jgi:hypothetical protein
VTSSLLLQRLKLRRGCLGRRRESCVCSVVGEKWTTVVSSLVRRVAVIGAFEAQDCGVASKLGVLGVSSLQLVREGGCDLELGD